MQVDTNNPSSNAPVAPAPVTLTDNAIEALKRIMDEEKHTGDALRVGVIGGGCSGLQYLLDFVKAPGAEDFVCEQDGVQIVVDPYSAAHLDGTVIDWVDDLTNTGFKFNNPRIQRSCGCGSSFST